MMTQKFEACDVAVAAPRPAARESAHERLIRAAYDLFQSHGIKAVGIDAIIERADVARMTFYRCFKSKHDLVLAFLERRKALWLDGWLRTGVAERGGTASERLLAIFDLYDEWFRRENYEGCPFLKVLFEDGPTGPYGLSAIRHLQEVQSFVEGLAAEAQLDAPDAFARSWKMLMDGAVVAAVAGNRDAARMARSAGEALLRDWPVAPLDGAAVARL